MITIDPRSLAGINNAQRAEAELRALGCVLSPAHDQLWYVPIGKIREARKISRENKYPAAFTALTEVVKAR